jgi:ABC-type nitrate/sulfonate/bicarbonate transport system ATPase subunit
MRQTLTLTLTLTLIGQEPQKETPNEAKEATVEAPVACLPCISLDVPVGSLLMLLGPVGCGKSALLQVLYSRQTHS